jgi:hypothetical protein
MCSGWSLAGTALTSQGFELPSRHRRLSGWPDLTESRHASSQTADARRVIDIRSADSPGFGSWPKSTALAKLVIAGLH